jgi:copper(I)-binding protein
MMFFGVTEPFVEGQTIPVRLVLERAGEIDVTLAVHRPTSHGHGERHGG